MLKSAFLVGFAVGAWRGGQRAALRFVAETQHSLAGIRNRGEAAAYWRLRNARTIVGAVQEGLWRATQLAGVAAVFVATREAWQATADYSSRRAQPDESARREPNVRRSCSSLMVASMATGALWLLVAPSSQRLRYAAKGVAWGGGLGAGLVVLQLVYDRLSRQADKL